jgi:hypothetical protein
MEILRIEVQGFSVHEGARRVAVRAGFYMKPKGSEEILNELVFWLQMDEGGEKVVEATGFFEPAASEEIQRRAKAGVKGGS